MAAETNPEQPRNLVIIALFMIVTLFTAWIEGYLGKISTPFWLSIIAGFGLAVWLALGISTKRLVSLILVIFILEYIKETIGIKSDMFKYHGIKEAYNFGVWAWVLGGLTVFALSTKIVIRQMRKIFPAPPRRMNLINLVILALLFLFIPVFLGNYWNGAGCLFWSLYGVLFLAGIIAAMQMELPVFLGIVITAIVVANLSEYVGSVPSHIWTFTHNPDYPPVFLLVGCWPLEILAQYLLSAYLANESTDTGTL